MLYRELASLLILCGLALANSALAADQGDAATLFKGANIVAGRALLAENKCNGSCHQSYTDDNDPLSLYTRSNRKVKDAKGLLAQVQRCLLRLNAGVFPEDSKDIAAVLNLDFYKFK